MDAVSAQYLTAEVLLKVVKNAKLFERYVSESGQNMADVKAAAEPKTELTNADFVKYYGDGDSDDTDGDEGHEKLSKLRACFDAGPVVACGSIA